MCVYAFTPLMRLHQSSVFVFHGSVCLNVWVASVSTCTALIRLCVCVRACWGCGGNEMHLDRCYGTERPLSATTHIPSKIWVLNTPRQGSLAQEGEPANGDKKKNIKNPKVS